MILTALAAASVGTQLQVTNFEPGTTVRYPLVILRGTAPDAPEAIAGLDWRHMVRFPIHVHRFVALAELHAGTNMVLVQAGKETLKLRLDYQPMTTPYRVVSVYVAPKDEPTDYDAPEGVPNNLYGEKLDNVLKLMQAFTAEAMNDAGYGRKTFALEFNAVSKVPVHVVRAEKAGAELRRMSGNDLWSYFNGVLEPQFPYDLDRVCAVMSFCHYSPSTGKALGHTALRGGGLGLFGGASMSTWPTTIADVPKVFSDETRIDALKQLDDSGLRGTMWASAATTIGAMLHEMGHTFGLPHSTDPMAIMSRGFDHFNRAFTVAEPPYLGHPDWTIFQPDQIAHWDSFHAARLNWNPWFQPDGNAGAKFPTSLAPKIELDAAADEYVVSSPYGLRVTGAEADNHPSTFQTYRDDAPKLVRLSRAKLRQGVGADAFTVYAEDEDGNEVRYEAK